MTKSTLHHFRIVAPGIIFIALSFTLAYPYFSEASISKFLTGLILPLGIVLTYPIGMLWRTMEVRRLALGDFWDSTNQKIASSLFEIVGSNRGLSDTEKKYLHSDNRYMDVFYMVLDDSETLRAKTQSVYSNGFIITTLVDIEIMSVVFATLHVVTALIFSFAPYHWTAAFLMFALALISAKFIRQKAIENHQNLSGKQLRVIESFHSDKVIDLCEQVLQKMPAVKG